MLRPEGEGVRVYLHREPVDMRLQRTGLAALAQEVLGQDAFGAGAIFAFVGKRYDRVKLLAWEKNGFVLWYKVIESEEIVDAGHPNLAAAGARLRKCIAG